METLRISPKTVLSLSLFTPRANSYIFRRMRKLPRREPIIASGGVGRLAMVVATVLITIWIGTWLKPITDSVVTAALDTVLPASLRPHPHTRP